MQACGKGSQLLRRDFLQPSQGHVSYSLFSLSYRYCPGPSLQITCFSCTGPRHTPFPPSMAEEDNDLYGHLLPSYSWTGAAGDQAHSPCLPTPGLASICPFMFHVFMPNVGLSVWFTHLLTHLCSLTCVRVHVHSVPALSCLCSARQQAHWCVHTKCSRLGL